MAGEVLVTKKQKIRWIELAQIISMLLIVLHHSIPKGFEVADSFRRFANTVHLPSLAVFFVVSGYFSVSIKKKGYAKYLRERAIRLLVPFVVINLLMYVPKMVIAKMGGKTTGFVLTEIVFSFIDAHGKGICPHLWYLLTLFILSAVLPLLIKLKEQNRIMKVTYLIVAYALTLFPNCTSIFCINELRLYLFYFSLGLFVHPLNIDKKTTQITLSTIGAFCIAVFVYFACQASPITNSIITAIGMVFVFGSAKIIESKFLAVIKLFEEKTFIIYLLSLPAQNLIEVIMPHVTALWIIATISMFAIGIMVPMIIWLVITAVNKRFTLPRVIKAAFGI